MPVQVALTAIVETALLIIKQPFPVTAALLQPYMLDAAKHVAADYPDDFMGAAKAMNHVITVVTEYVTGREDKVPEVELRKIVEEERKRLPAPSHSE